MEKMGLKVALITPYYLEAMRGNAVTVRRLELHLRQQGVELSVFSLDGLSDRAAVAEVITGGFDLCHAFHAHLGGNVAREVKEHSGTPYLVTLTGSDLYEALLDERRKETLANLGAASGIVAFHEVLASRIALESEPVTDKITVIPQGVDLPAINIVSAQQVNSDEFTFLLPAGIRPVKDLIFPLSPLQELHRKHPAVRLLIAGPVLDKEYASQLFAALPDYPFAEYIGAVGHEHMGELYRKSGVVLNSSRFEGGMANSLLEAMAWGIPVLASDIEGNRSLVTDGVNGLLYRNPDEFARNAEVLMSNPELHQRLGLAGRKLMEGNHSPEHEALEYMRLYRKILYGSC